MCVSVKTACSKHYEFCDMILLVHSPYRVLYSSHLQMFTSLDLSMKPYNTPKRSKRSNDYSRLYMASALPLCSQRSGKRVHGSGTTHTYSCCLDTFTPYSLPKTFQKPFTKTPRCSGTWIRCLCFLRWLKTAWYTYMCCVSALSFLITKVSALHVYGGIKQEKHIQSSLLLLLFLPVIENCTKKTHGQNQPSMCINQTSQRFRLF